MRTVLASLASTLALTSTALGAQEQVAHAFTLGSYYSFETDGYTYLKGSDNNPWYVLQQASWADPALLQLGYLAVGHDGKHYYCLIEHAAPIGTRIAQRAYFICGDPTTAEMLYTRGILR
jgi:hypothetical protein